MTLGTELKTAFAHHNRRNIDPPLNPNQKAGEFQSLTLEGGTDVALPPPPYTPHMMDTHTMKISTMNKMVTMDSTQMDTATDLMTIITLGTCSTPTCTKYSGAG